MAVAALGVLGLLYLIVSRRAYLDAQRQDAAFKSYYHNVAFHTAPTATNHKTAGFGGLL